MGKTQPNGGKRKFVVCYHAKNLIHRQKYEVEAKCCKGNCYESTILIDWLADWLVDWLISWLIDWVQRGIHQHIPDSLSNLGSNKGIQPKVGWRKTTVVSTYGKATEGLPLAMKTVCQTAEDCTKIQWSGGQTIQGETCTSSWGLLRVIEIYQVIGLIDAEKGKVCWSFQSPAIIRLYFFIGAQIAQVTQPIWIALAGQLGQSRQQ